MAWPHQPTRRIGHTTAPRAREPGPAGLCATATDQAAVALDGLSRREHFTDPDDRVFINHVGDVLGQDLLRRRFKTALVRAELQPMRLHDLRHSFGTLAVQAFPLSDVKAYMGHANIDTTMLYVHHVPQHDAADKLSALVTGAQSMDPTMDRTGCMDP